MYNIMSIIYNMVIYAKNVFCGFFVAKKILHDNPGAHIIFSAPGMGDQIAALSFIAEYKKRSKASRTVYLSERPDHAIIKYYRDQVDDVQQISSRDIEALRVFYRSAFGPPYYRGTGKRLLLSWILACINNPLLLENGTTLDFIQIAKALYKLPLSTEPCGIDERKIDYSCIEKYQEYIEPGNTVILNPYANLWGGVPLSFFCAIAEKLKAAGMKVISSAMGDQAPVKGSIPLNFDMVDAVPLFNICGYVIGVRSGFLDLAAQTRAVIASVDSNELFFSDCFRLEAWGKSETIRSFRWSEEKTDETADAIVKFILHAKEIGEIGLQ